MIVVHASGFRGELLLWGIAETDKQPTKEALLASPVRVGRISLGKVTQSAIDRRMNLCQSLTSASGMPDCSTA